DIRDCPQTFIFLTFERGYTVIWVAREDVPEWVVYEMLK
ncbi:unnamed protein product, partial [marine sediment metagenome]